jgi:hypothetical protein
MPGRCNLLIVTRFASHYAMMCSIWAVHIFWRCICGTLTPFLVNTKYPHRGYCIVPDIVRYLSYTICGWYSYMPGTECHSSLHMLPCHAVMCSIWVLHLYRHSSTIFPDLWMSCHQMLKIISDTVIWFVLSGHSQVSVLYNVVVDTVTCPVERCLSSLHMLPWHAVMCSIWVLHLYSSANDVFEIKL